MMPYGRNTESVKFIPISKMDVAIYIYLAIVAFHAILPPKPVAPLRTEPNPLLTATRAPKIVEARRRIVSRPQLGYVQKDGSEPMPLHGGPVRPSSRKFEYYVITVDSNVKIPIPRANDEELFHGDPVSILGGSWEVVLYDIPQY
jgi:hypothetical protein